LRQLCTAALSNYCAGFEIVTERPILFSGPMVQAILAGRKTQTRRALKPQPPEDTGSLIVGEHHPTKVDRHGEQYPGAPVHGAYTTDGEWAVKCRYGAPGDRLWVRETFAEKLAHTGKPLGWAYRADGERADYELGGGRWTPSIHMPRVACRLELEVTAVRVERLQDISEDDAKAEGCAAKLHGTWWQGYKDVGGTIGLLHQQAEGETPPDWMIEPHKDIPRPWLDRPAKDAYKLLWDSINGAGAWAANPWVWVVEFKSAATSTRTASK
jgi:hypothetical protein